jgi:hypothetical protein
MGLPGWPELLVVIALLCVVAPLVAIYFIVRAAVRKKEGGDERSNEPTGVKDNHV